MEFVIDTLATGLGSFLGFFVPIIAPFIFSALWIAFAWALIASQGSLDATWQWIRDLPLLLQAVVWLLFLPVVAGLWVYETGWPFVLRIVLIASIGGWNLWILAPRGILGK
jgi:hypothetical protein